MTNAADWFPVEVQRYLTQSCNYKNVGPDIDISQNVVISFQYVHYDVERPRGEAKAENSTMIKKGLKGEVTMIPPQVYMISTMISQNLCFCSTFYFCAPLSMYESRGAEILQRGNCKCYGRRTKTYFQV